jgi:hypothetical protein
VGSFPELLKRLGEMPLSPIAPVAQFPVCSAIYVIFEAGKPLYVGRTRNLRRRLRNHLRLLPGQSAFAFRLARELTGNPKASYTTAGSRKMLMQDAGFRKAFTDSGARIAHMSVRWIEIADPIAQHLFEVYVALAYETPYNDFDTH